MGKKRKFGALDVVVILFVIAVVVVAVKFFATDQGKTTANSGQDVSFTVEILKVNETFLDEIAVGDKVYDVKAGGYLGTVSDMELVPYKETTYDPASDSAKDVAVDGLLNALITVDATAEISDRKTSVSGVDIMVGAPISMHSGGFAGTGYCVILEER